ncbi:MAG: ester cyclase [Chloroflexi bacterium]|nr:ester cyclase [Chloroflexota bacterium]
MSEENKSVAQLLHLEIIQNYNLDLADKVIHPDCIIHTPVADPRPGRGPESAKEMSRYDKDMFPDGMTFDHYNIIGEGDLVSFCWVAKGKHKSGKSIEFKGIDVVRIADGKIAEIWVSYDLVGIQNQLK